jgi:hypothetical protein
MYHLLFWASGQRYTFKPDGTLIPHKWDMSGLLTLEQAIMLLSQIKSTAIYTDNGQLVK